MDHSMKRSDERDADGEPVAESLRLDGNAAAGMLSEVFAADMTAALARCANCGTARPVGALLVYAHGMGMVVRCPGCDAIVLRAARTPTKVWLDLRGASHVVVAGAPPAR